MKRLMLAFVFPCLLFFLSGSGCRYPEPFEYQSNREVKNGPGLFTGEEEAWIIYESDSATVSSETEAVGK